MTDQIPVEPLNNPWPESVNVSTAYVTMTVSGGKPEKRRPRLVVAAERFIRTLFDEDYDECYDDE